MRARNASGSEAKSTKRPRSLTACILLAALTIGCDDSATSTSTATTSPAPTPYALKAGEPYGVIPDVHGPVPGTNLSGSHVWRVQPDGTNKLEEKGAPGLP